MGIQVGDMIDAATETELLNVALAGMHRRNADLLDEDAATLLTLFPDHRVALEEAAFLRRDAADLRACADVLDAPARR